jgi:hypothetical protein
MYFFVPGTFGSMIEMALRGATSLDGTLDIQVAADGSAHRFMGRFHPGALNEIVCEDPDLPITTVRYPFADTKLDEILQRFEQVWPNWHTDTKILIRCPDMAAAELNLLMQHHKIGIGTARCLQETDHALSQHEIKMIQLWNPSYQHWLDMKRWEYREWFSLFYPGWVQDWMPDTPQGFVVLTNMEILQDVHQVLDRIVQVCGVTATDRLAPFLDQWRSRQQYVIDEHATIQSIVPAVLGGQDLEWPGLSIIGEAILQNHFRRAGHEWRCQDLDQLPTNSVQLRDIIYPTQGSTNA